MDITSVNAILALLATGIEIAKLDRATDPFVIDLRTLTVTTIAKLAGVATEEPEEEHQFH